MNLHEKRFETIEDFLLDPSFRKWVFNKDHESGNFWKNWSSEHPEKSPLFNYCFGILHNLYMQHKSISDDEVKREIEIILSKIREEEARADKQKTSPAIVRFISKNWMWTAAAAVVILAVSIFLFTNEHTTASYAAFAKKVKTSSVEYINNSDTVQVVQISDGSKVSLYQNSKITYALVDNRREVYMQGKGFFEVKKNPSQPFIVFTDKLITKVLGTSFLVDAYPTNRTVSVIVRTGKVSVYKRKDFKEKETKSLKLDGVLITPNQQVVLDEKKNDLVKLLVDQPVKVAAVPETNLHFEATPLKTVFSAIEKEYGIHILYDEESLAECTLTARLGDESFYDKLNIITKAIGGTFVVIDGNILVTAAGCK